jgi:23S rRNA (guanosine2251-2'-O)-methyltransferase
MSEVIFGRNPVEELLMSNQNIDKIYIDNQLRGDFEKRIRSLTKDKKVSLVRVPKEKLDREIRKDHQGILAFISPVQFQKFEDILASIYDKGENPLFVVLDGVTDVGNFGAIARSAFVLGAHAILIGTKGTARLNDEAMKASSGALAHIPVCRENGIAAILDTLRKNGIYIAATSSHDAKDASTADLKTPLALILGDEGRGVSDFILKESDFNIRIPQIGEFDSLNVSVAAGILLYEVMMQRGDYRTK